MIEDETAEVFLITYV